MGEAFDITAVIRGRTCNNIYIPVEVIPLSMSTIKNAQKIIVMSEDGIRQESREEFFAANAV